MSTDKNHPSAAQIQKTHNAKLDAAMTAAITDAGKLHDDMEHPEI